MEFDLADGLRLTRAKMEFDLGATTVSLERHAIDIRWMRAYGI